MQRPAFFAGLAIVVAAIGSIPAAIRHPSIAHAHGERDVLVQMVALRTTDQVVHGVILTFAVILVYGFAGFAIRRGIERPAVLAGLVAYAIGTTVVMGAGAIDGFMLPALAARYVDAPDAQVAVALQLSTLCAIAIQALTKIWLVCVSAAVALWSWDIVRSTRAQWGVATVGLVSGAAIIGFALFGRGVSAHILGVLGLAQAAWNVWIGALLMRGEV